MSSFPHRLRRVLVLLVPVWLACAMPALAQEAEKGTEAEESADAESAASSAPRAVKALNGWVGGEYVFEATDTTPNPLRNQNTETGRWLLVGNVTVPIGERLGARVQLLGGEQSITSGYDAFGDGERSAVGGFFELFWRDAGLGTLGLGYSITNHERTFAVAPPSGFVPPVLRPLEENVQVFSTSGSLYLGDLDLDASFQVSPRTAAEITPLNVDETGSRATEFLLGFGPRYYAADWLALRARFVWSRIEEAVVLPAVPTLNGPLLEYGKSIANTYEGRLALDVQLPTIGRGPIFVSLFGAAGLNDLVEVPPGFVILGGGQQMYWNVGGSIVVAFPRPDSIQQWVREYR